MFEDCTLCALEKRTEWFFENEMWVVMECDTCHIPMVVSREHTSNVEPLDKFEAQGLAMGLFGSGIEFRDEMRDIKGHYHFHIEGANV